MRQKFNSCCSKTAAPPPHQSSTNQISSHAAVRLPFPQPIKYPIRPAVWALLQALNAGTSWLQQKTTAWWREIEMKDSKTDWKHFGSTTRNVRADLQCLRSVAFSSNPNFAVLFCLKKVILVFAYCRTTTAKYSSIPSNIKNKRTFTKFPH